MMQPRFEKRVGSAPFGLVEQPRFRAGFDFMRLRADIGEIEPVLADWWEDFSLAGEELRQDMVDQVREEQSRQRAKAPRMARGPGERAPAMPQEGGEEPVTDEAAAPKKRRRRRRSGAKKSGDAASGASE